MKLKSLLSLLVGLILVISCGDQKKELPPIDPAFTNYIKGFTAGVVSNSSSIKIKLAEHIQQAVAGEELKIEVFDFSPDIAGKTVWIDSKSLEFIPDEKLPSGTIYDVEFELGELQEVPDKLSTFEFRFQTIKQEIYVSFDGMQAYEDDQLQWQQLSGKIQTSDIADLEALQQSLHASQNGKDLNINWEFAATGNSHVFKVDSVSRKESPEKVILSWNGELIDSESEGEEVIEIPALGDFKVMGISLQQLPDQKIIINFSDPLSKTQNLEGLVYLKEADEVRIGRSRNSITLYPKKDLSGEKTVVVSKGIKNSLSYGLKTVTEKKLSFSSMKPEVAFIGKGNIVPANDGFKIPIKAVNLSGVNVKVIKVFEDNVAQFLQTNQFDGTNELKRVGRIIYKESIPLVSEKSLNLNTWNTYELDLSNLVKTEPGAIYRISLEFDQSQSLYPCDTAFEDQANYEITDEELASFDKPSDYYWDYYDYYDYGHDYDYRDRENPCKSSYYQRGNHSITKNILASSIGIIAKSGDENQIKIAVTSLIDTKPISGATIEIYNFQQQLMETISTNSDGFADIDLKSKPFLIIAKNGSEKGYLRVDDGSALSLSMFDVSGEQNKKGVKGFIYGERGVWRPGDSLYLSFIIEDKNQALPENHPVIFELYNPENQLYQRIVKNNGLNGFYDFRTKTERSSPTGNWQAKVKVGNSTFYKRIKIEAIKPNRLKINIDFNHKILGQNKTDGILSSKWLHGADADGLKAIVEMNLSGGNTQFKGYEEFQFDDPTESFTTEEKVVFEGQLNTIGETSISPNIEVTEGAPGMLQANFKTRVFEKGGDFSIDRFKTVYSPYKSYAGVKVPKGEGWNGALYSNEVNLIPIVTLDEEGKPVNRKDVKIEIYDIRWRWWWERGNTDDLSRYVKRGSQHLIKSGTVSTVDGKALYQLKFDNERWGRKLILVTDPVSGHTTGTTFYLTYKGWWSRSGSNNPGGAEMLNFSTNKKKYQVGEEVEIKLPEIKSGRILVSLESGSKIIDQFWKDASEVQEGIRFKTSKEMSPNIYAHLTLIQPHQNTSNDLPIRMYGVQNIEVEAAETHLNPVLTMPDELEPEQKVKLRISEKDGKKMTYTIAVVDEGLLDLTRFKTPNPWPHFYKREALGVKSWDMYQYVMGAFSGEISGLLALGGDDALNAGEGNKANRFEPVVRFLGPFNLGSGDENDHEFTMPNYVGSVRTMVIAGNKGAYGATEKTTAVKKPLMVLATLPRLVSPTEQLKLPVTVFAMDEGINQVTVKVKTNEFFKLKETQKEINFSKIGDQIVYFDIEVLERIGVGKVSVEVSGNGESASHEIEIEIRLPNPEIDHVVSAVIEPGETWTQSYEPIGIKGTNKGLIELSSIPPLNLEMRLKYLIQYPHGCVEQTTSSVFPQLHLADLLNLDDDQKKKIQYHIDEAIFKLRTFQLSSGGFSYWPGGGSANDWGTTYAGHFLLEAKAKGYSLPPGMFADWLKYQQRAANSWTPSYSSYNSKWYSRAQQLQQAYRLYTLALAGKPAMGAMNRLREGNNLFAITKWRLAAAYALANKVEVAKEMIKELDDHVEPYTNSYTYGSYVRDEALILETMHLIGDKQNGKKVMDRIAGKLGSRKWYSTQTTSYSLLAISKFLGKNGSESGMEYDFELNGSSNSFDSEEYFEQHNLPEKKGKIKISNNGDKTLFAQLNLSGVPLTGDSINKNSRINMSVNYLNLDGSSIDPSRLEQGTDFIAEVTIKHPGGIEDDFKDLALTQLFPSGWEIRNLRMDETSSNLLRDKPDYQDVRDDRVFSYFDLQRNSRKTFRILLNAAYLGNFYLPAVECSAMYDNEIQAIQSGRWVEVVK